MKAALVTPTQAGGPNGNPGWVYITSGIKRHLRGLGFTDFLAVDMMADDPAGWREARSADLLVMCGNPRFNATEERVWWDWGVWDRINATIGHGVPFFDAWAGSAVPFGCKDPLGTLLAVEKNRAVLAWESRATRLVARDKDTKALFDTIHPGAELLPCSSSLAPLELGVEPGEKAYSAVILRRMPGHKLKVRELAESLPDPCHLVAVNAQDAEAFRDLNPLLIPDPVELLRFLARAGCVHSLRVHASIPAHALGADVVHYAIDSRADTVTPFGICVVPFTELVGIPPDVLC